MNFTPNDIQNILFKKSLFGFNRLQVDDVLEKIVEDMADYIRDNNKLKEKLEDTQEKLGYYRGIETALQNSLIIAQQTSEEIVANAKKNAENILKEAELESKRSFEGTNQEILAVRFEYERLKRELDAFRVRAESIIRAQLKSLQDLTDDGNGNSEQKTG